MAASNVHHTWSWLAFAAAGALAALALHGCGERAAIPDPPIAATEKTTIEAQIQQKVAVAAEATNDVDKLVALRDASTLREASLKLDLKDEEKKNALLGTEITTAKTRRDQNLLLEVTLACAGAALTCVVLGIFLESVKWFLGAAAFAAVGVLASVLSLLGPYRLYIEWAVALAVLSGVVYAALHRQSALTKLWAACKQFGALAGKEEAVVKAVEGFGSKMIAWVRKRV